MKSKLFMLLVVACLAAGVLSSAQAAESATIKKCLIKARAGNKDQPIRGTPEFVARDSILILGTLDATIDDFAGVDQIQVTLDSADIQEPLDPNFPVNDDNLKNGKYNYARTENASKMLFKLDTKNGKFLFKVKNIDLTGLSCPVRLEIRIGSYVAEVQIDEDIVNGKKPIPIQLMMGIKDILQVNKFKVKFGKKPSTDRLFVKGVFTVQDSNALQGGIDNGDIFVNLGSQTFTFPGPNKSNSVKFDLSKCTFVIKIKKADITESDLVDFSIELLGINLESLQKIDLGARRTYGLEELRRYDAFGTEWLYEAGYNITFRPKGIGIMDDISDLVEFRVWITGDDVWFNGHDCYEVNGSIEGEDPSISNYWYADGEGIHYAGGLTSSLFEYFHHTDLVLPIEMRIGQKFSDSAPFVGEFILDGIEGVCIDGACISEFEIDDYHGTARHTMKLIGHEEVAVPKGEYNNAVKGEYTNASKGTMRFHIEGTEYGSPFSFDGKGSFTVKTKQTWWGVPGVGTVKCITKSTAKLRLSRLGSFSIKISETDELIDWSD